LVQWTVIMKATDNFCRCTILHESFCDCRESLHTITTYRQKSSSAYLVNSGHNEHWSAMMAV